MELGDREVPGRILEIEKSMNHEIPATLYFSTLEGRILITFVGILQDLAPPAHKVPR